MDYDKFEVPQNDGITVKERIIRFFEKAHSREDAEILYSFCLKNGKERGVKAFDQAIELVCSESGLDSDELAKEIELHNNSKSN